jgi:hypothetical protein
MAFGHALANAPMLTKRQAAAGQTDEARKQ